MTGNIHDIKRIEIRTFGEFDICCDGKSVLDALGRSSKLLDLLKFLIVFNGKRILAETLIASLFENEEYPDPKSVLRAQIFRLKKYLEDMESRFNLAHAVFILTHSNGYYQFDISVPCLVDFQMFEGDLKTFESSVIQQMEEVKPYIHQCISLYKGEFLADGITGDWVVPFRNKYSRLYHQKLVNYLSILENSKKFDEIIEICESAIMIQPYEETFHIFYMEAMLGKGMIQQASSHYGYTTQKMYLNYDIKPSALMKCVYYRIQSEIKDKHVMDLSAIESRMCEDNGCGAVHCETEYFHFVYNLEKRRAARDPVDKVVGLITLSAKEQDTHRTNKASKNLKFILSQQLRNGDIFAQWNERQVIMLLHHSNYSHVDDLKQRITSSFKESKDHSVELSFTFHTIEKFLE